MSPAAPRQRLVQLDHNDAGFCRHRGAQPLYMMQSASTARCDILHCPGWAICQDQIAYPLSAVVWWFLASLVVDRRSVG
ncbi:hypothetical protein Micbo1qcDRAFT_164014 [Microdochium bolleyi]|uniref:Uncharacterized protein n=1 Tax=Microdochium bolleyi TaxID=196109 RepID=A0A136IZT3_9PEZI|nr:hypothetical protein Micbo1qcDRAFT_164014 [Microdochium bolleyi]